MMDMISVYLATLSEAEEKSKEDSFGKKALKVAGLATLALGAGYAMKRGGAFLEEKGKLQMEKEKLKELKQAHDVRIQMIHDEHSRHMNDEYKLKMEKYKIPFDAEATNRALKQRDADMRYREKKIAARENPEWWKRNYHDYTPEFIHEQFENGWVYDPARKDFNHTSTAPVAHRALALRQKLKLNGTL